MLYSELEGWMMALNSHIHILYAQETGIFIRSVYTYASLLLAMLYFAMLYILSILHTVIVYYFPITLNPLIYTYH